jgi:NADPH:quinone reductase
MSKALVIRATGGPEVMRWEDVEVGAPAPGEARIRHTAIGANFIDIYQRSGVYPQPLPLITGMEGAGRVVAVGKGVRGLKIGDRVCYSGVVGAYCEERLVPADKLIRIPRGISDVQAAGMLHRGITVYVLLRQAHRVRRGETILLHAAAGGVGLIACQWAKALGATVIGTVGSDAKAALARRYGCDHPIVYTRENFVDAVRAITKGRGVPVVYDAVGKDTFPGSLDCIQPHGLFAIFGNSSGPLPAIDTVMLMRKGSLFVTRVNAYHYLATRPAILEASRALFRMVRSGRIKIEVNQTYPLKEAARCHQDMADRRTTGSTVLIPG